jgi:hypothetical protein
MAASLQLLQRLGFSLHPFPDDLSRGGNEFCAAQSGKIPAAIMINNALGTSICLLSVACANSAHNASQATYS